MRLRPGVALGIPLEDDPVVADHEERGGVPVLEDGPGRFQRGGVHPLALGGCRGPVPGRFRGRFLARWPGWSVRHGPVGRHGPLALLGQVDRPLLHDLVIAALDAGILMEDDQDRLRPPLPHPGDDRRMVGECEPLRDKGPVVAEPPAAERRLLELEDVAGPGILEGLQLIAPGTRFRSRSARAGMPQGLDREGRAIAAADRLSQLRPGELDDLLAHGWGPGTEQPDEDQDHPVRCPSSVVRCQSGGRGVIALEWRRLAGRLARPSAGLHWLSGGASYLAAGRDPEERCRKLQPFPASRHYLEMRRRVLGAWGAWRSVLRAGFRDTSRRCSIPGRPATSPTGCCWIGSCRRATRRRSRSWWRDTVRWC